MNRSDFRHSLQQVNACQTAQAPRQLHLRRDLQSAFKIELNNQLQVTSESKAEPVSSSRSGRIAAAVQRSSRQYGVSEHLIYAVIKQESNFNPKATSHCGAQGLMQLMPKTAESLGVSDAYNIEQNVDGGTKYLAQLLEKFDGKVDLALAGYNAGPNAVIKHNGIPPYRETRNYVKNILHTLKNEKTPFTTPIEQDQPMLAHNLPPLDAVYRTVAEPHAVEGPRQVSARSSLVRV